MTEVRNVAAPEEPDRLRTMAASSEGFVDPEYLIDSDWLACHLDDPGLRVLDCTVHIVFEPALEIRSGKPDCLRAHIPGAQFVDVLTVEHHARARPDPEAAQRRDPQRRMAEMAA